MTTPLLRPGLLQRCLLAPHAPGAQPVGAWTRRVALAVAVLHCERGAALVAPVEWCLLSPLGFFLGAKQATRRTRLPLHLRSCHLTPLLLLPLLLLPDPFADAEAAATAEEEEETQNVTKGKAYVHVRVQQRNGRKSLTTVQVRGVAC